jgi:CheY-like chemotaxis protein
MHFIADTIDRRASLPADGLCEDALAVFVRDPDCRALAVTEADKPVAVVCRDAFLARMEAPGASARPILDVAEPDPLIVEASAEAASFVAAANRHRPLALLTGFVVVEDGVYVGVSDLARLLPALDSATADRPGLIESICAEVREPVAHALAATEGLRRMRLPNGAAAHLDTIADAARATLSLLDVAAELQRAESARLEISVAPCRLQALMDDIEARWREQAELAGVTLLVAYDGAPDVVASIDADRLMQVFDALIGHALAHAGGGVIEAQLRVRPTERGFQLAGRVRDNGATYSVEHLTGMFRDHAYSVQAGGIGVQLGLMLAERSLAAMNGAIEAKTNPGPGAVIAFEFPAEAAHGEAAKADQPSLAPAARSAHILVVDDNATNRMVVEALCEMFDCSTESVVDGMEAVEAAKSGRFDVILMDIKMPRMDGVTAAKEIRKLPAAAGRVPIIALTANADADEVAAYVAAGMRTVVEKPIKPERLMEALDAALSGGDQKAAAA